MKEEEAQEKLWKLKYENALNFYLYFFIMIITLIIFLCNTPMNNIFIAIYIFMIIFIIVEFYHANTIRIYFKKLKELYNKNINNKEEVK